jgi:hypothetical protein
MKPIDLVYVPYDSGHREVRMGRGPLHLCTHGASSRLRAAGLPAAETVIEAANRFATEVGIAASCLGSYDPAFDVNDRMLATTLDLVEFGTRRAQRLIEA